MNNKKIVSCSPAHTEIICELGQENLIVGKTSICDFPKDKVANITSVGSLNDLDYDEIIDLNPDLIITIGVVQAKIAHGLKDKGFNVYHSDPSTIEDIYEEIRNIAKIVNAEANGEELIAKMKNGLEEIKRNAPEKRTKLYIEEWHDPPTISGNWVTELANIAGADYSLIESKKPSSPVSIEKLFTFNPSKIIISWSGFGKKVDTIEVLNREGWDSLEAIKNKEVYIIEDSLLNHPSPRIINGAKLIQDILKEKSHATNQ